MGATDVYSWRVEPELLDRLKEEAAARETSVSRLLAEIAQRWLEASAEEEDAESVQARLHAAAAACVGAFDGGDPDRSSDVRRRVRDRLTRRRAS